jgi:RNA polymerase sigma factor (TIGR02999 family)
LTDRNADNITALLQLWQAGDVAARDQLLLLVQEPLRRLARQSMRRERPGHTLQTTALVNEAYLRLVGQSGNDWSNRAHFFAVSAQVMRRILVDYARQRGADKRGGAWQRVTLEDALHLRREPDADLVALDDALRDLETLNARAVRVVELRHFGGLNNEAIAEVLGISPTTVERDWRFAKAWLYREIETAADE